MPATRNVYTPVELAAIRRRVRLVLADGRLLGPKVVQPRADGCVNVILQDMPQGIVVNDILIDRVPVAMADLPFTTAGGPVWIGLTPQVLGLVPVATSILREVN